MQRFTDRGQYLHGPHGGLDVEPELLQRQQALPLEVLQLGDQDQVLLHQGPHRCREGVVHLAVLEGRLLLDETRSQTQRHRLILLLWFEGCWDVFPNSPCYRGVVRRHR